MRKCSRSCYRQTASGVPPHAPWKEVCLTNRSDLKRNTTGRGSPEQKIELLRRNAVPSSEDAAQQLRLPISSCSHLFIYSRKRVSPFPGTPPVHSRLRDPLFLFTIPTKPSRSITPPVQTELRTSSKRAVTSKNGWYQNTCRSTVFNLYSCTKAAIEPAKNLDRPKTDHYQTSYLVSNPAWPQNGIKTRKNGGGEMTKRKDISKETAIWKAKKGS